LREIVLIRHGRPNGATNPKVSAAGFARWVKRYNASTIDPKSPPPKELAQSLKKHFVVTSHLPRAIHSAQCCVKTTPNLTLKILREMDIPHYKFPFKLNVYTWLVINRLCWVAGLSARVESFKTAKNRAKIAAHSLVELTERHGNVAVFGHGMMNKYITKELSNAGWNVSSSQGNNYWNVTILNQCHR